MDLDQMRDALKRGTFKNEVESETKSKSISPEEVVKPKDYTIPMPEKPVTSPRTISEASKAPSPRNKEVVYKTTLRYQGFKSDKEYVVIITAENDGSDTEYMLSAEWGRTGKLHQSQDKYATYSKVVIMARARKLIASKIKKGYKIASTMGTKEFTMPTIFK